MTEAPLLEVNPGGDLVARASECLHSARRSGKPIRDLPDDLVPADLATAYAIQDRTVLDTVIGGWKVAGGKGGAEPRCSVVGRDDIHDARTGPATLDASLMRPELEVEIGVRLARDLLPAGRAFTEINVLAAIGSLHLAVEVISSRFLDRKAVSPFSTIADQQSCSGIFVGPVVADWRNVDFAEVDLTLAFDGREVAAKTGGPARSEVMGWLVWLANHAAGRAGGLRAGQIIITGARLGPLALEGTRKATASSRVLGSIDIAVRT